MLGLWNVRDSGEICHMINWPKWKSDVKLPSWPETEPKTNVRHWYHDLVLNVVFAGYGGELLLTLSLQTVCYLFGVIYLWVLCLLSSHVDSKKSTFFGHIAISYILCEKVLLILLQAILWCTLFALSPICRLTDPKKDLIKKLVLFDKEGISSCNVRP